MIGAGTDGAASAAVTTGCAPGPGPSTEAGVGSTAGALRPGGVQPGGGTNALFGSTCPERADATTVAVGTGALLAAVTLCAGGGDAGDGDGDGVGDGIGAGALAVSTRAGWLGGSQPAGGTNALLGSAGFVGIAATATGVETGVAAGAGSVAGGDATAVTGGDATVVTTGVAAGVGDGVDGGGADGDGGDDGSDGAVDGGGASAAAVSTGGGTGVVVTVAGGGAVEVGAVEDGDEAGGVAAAIAASDALRSAARRSASARSLAARAALSLARDSCCAFWPPLAATMDPIRGPERVSSTSAMPGSYRWPAPAEGRPLAATDRSAPGRTCLLLTGVLSSNQPQPPSRASVETPRSRPPYRPPPILSRYPRIFAIHFSAAPALCSGLPEEI